MKIHLTYPLGTITDCGIKFRGRVSRNETTMVKSLKNKDIYVSAWTSFNSPVTCKKCIEKT